MVLKNWEFDKLDATGRVGHLPDPPGYELKTEDASAKSAGSKTSSSSKAALLEKKAWETCLAPIQSVGMNLFMLWMSGSSPGIFSIMILGYCMTSIVGQYSRMNTAFAPYKEINHSLQKLAYFALCTVSLAYLLYHASGMGVLPTSSGDWIAFIPTQQVTEIAGGVVN
mmetsp:Transcript_49926/g.79007  ORF Transcript_49926/g.79007 Transcript_49926/m.79007 type:complete len:168 (+) Transcript_49926:50-553(+)|eukprot:CAMPEP_0169123148 /NCGR_PEP_ID=MMETSP1015-20121227/33629_1 /TAXON_ID=342587 /ORGANISM="Karlodinium micrum, Strain CCMP2283" /LENGTH=167 /DNA_ID=CAMNT_0009186463 /DNA_START=50 /DNA_END=553 /DNA_ORIENTATION=+